MLVSIDFVTKSPAELGALFDKKKTNEIFLSEKARSSAGEFVVKSIIPYAFYLQSSPFTPSSMSRLRFFN